MQGEHPTEQSKAREVIEAFDAAYDQPLAHHLAMAELERNRAFSSDEPAIATGAAWCRIVQADVEYRLADALTVIDASRAAAASLEGATDTFSRYVLARYDDGAGKVLFRCGDYAEAIVRFARAFETARAEPSLWHVVEDIRSNLLRARFDVHDMAMRASGLRSDTDARCMQIATELALALEAAAPGAPTAPPPEPPPLGDPPTREALQRREHLRGLCSLAHNISVITSDLDRALAWSRWSEQLATSLGDGYRRAQAVQQQAIKLARTDPTASRERFALLKTLGWRRGNLIARQQQARASNDVEALRALLAELRREVSSGLDLRAWQYTARALVEVQQAGARTYDPHPDMLDAIRAIRRVTKIAPYKRVFAEQMKPLFLEEASRALTAAPGPSLEDPREHLVAVIEESAARELLDLLSSSNIAVPPPPSRAPLPPQPVAPRLDGSLGRRRRLRRVSTADEANHEMMSEAVRAQRHSWEEAMMGRPVPVRDPDPGIGRALRAFTAQGLTERDGGTVIVRFFEYHAPPAASAPRVEGGRVGPELGALVYAAGQRPRFVTLDTTAITSLARTISERDAPDARAASDLSRLVIAPLGLPPQPAHVVFIPAGLIFNLPLHIAYDGTSLLGARVPVTFSVSATAFLGGRYLKRAQPIDPDDDLCALIPTYTEQGQQLSADDVSVAWGARHFHIAGARPAELPEGSFAYVGRGDLDGLSALASTNAELFVYIGHGQLDADGEPILLLDDGPASPYALMLRARLGRNKLTVLSTCVAGQQSKLDGGEVAGFVRSLTAMGAGALALTLWSVKAAAAEKTTRALLDAAICARDHTDGPRLGIVDFAATLMQHHQRERTDSIDDWIERCPFMLYL